MYLTSLISFLSSSMVFCACLIEEGVFVEGVLKGPSRWARVPGRCGL